MIPGRSSGFDRLYAFRVLAMAGVLWYFRKTYAGWRWTWNWGAFALGVVVFAVWMALEPSSKSTSEDVLATGLLSMPTGWTVIWLIFRIVGSVVTVPLAEELAFRGYLMRRLIATDFEAVPLGRLPGSLSSSPRFYSACYTAVGSPGHWRGFLCVGGVPAWEAV